jgi:hypothetical protein
MTTKKKKATKGSKIVKDSGKKELVRTTIKAGLKLGYKE